jgi:hypothetical protein
LQVQIVPLDNKILTFTAGGSGVDLSGLTNLVAYQGDRRCYNNALEET